MAWAIRYPGRSDNGECEITDPLVAEKSDENARTMGRHGRASNIGGRGKNRVHNKGLSAYNDMVVEMEMSQTESELSGVMMARYSICHGIDDFPSGEEPVPGTFDCRVCGMDMSSVHHAYEHTHACAAEAAAAKAQLLLDTLCLLGQPCQYQFCGEKDKFRQFDTCEKAFDSRAQLWGHMRSHMRTMRKRNDNGEWVPTCFFGDCALNPELGRNKRNGPDFASEEERLVHLWSKHRVNTLKALGHMLWDTGWQEHCPAPLSFLLPPESSPRPCTHRYLDSRGPHQAHRRPPEERSVYQTMPMLSGKMQQVRRDEHRSVDQTP
jgi:hypothetical protein